MKRDLREGPWKVRGLINVIHGEGNNGNFPLCEFAQENSITYLSQFGNSASHVVVEGPSM